MIPEPISRIQRTIKRNVIDFIEVVIILSIGLLGLIFIFMAPFESPEDREKSFWQKLKETLQSIDNSLSEKFTGINTVNEETKA
ncbi:MAG: hypothetical protein MJZ12_04705 [Prevotella sp.]|nr:hypothetical protein [Prevotella sp.]